MDESLSVLCKALKDVCAVLKPKQNPLAFALVIGRLHQGKSTILKHSELTNFPLASPNVAIYYHEDGIILELCESWLRDQHVLLSHVLKKLNQINRYLRISALILCIDVQALFHNEHDTAMLEGEKHTKWVKHFIDSLGYAVSVSIFLTKSDSLAGFLPFFQPQHTVERQKALGFSIDNRLEKPILLKQYRQQFDKLVASLNRQVLERLHVVRSVAARTQIREFPLQLVSLRTALQLLLECMVKQGAVLQGVYFMSAASHAATIDRLQHKFSQDYGLLPYKEENQGPKMHPAYFVKGALENVLMQNKLTEIVWPSSFRWTVVGSCSFLLFFLASFFYIYNKTNFLLTETKQELAAYELLIKSKNYKETAATFHLTEALRTLEAIPIPMRYLPAVKKLRVTLEAQTEKTIEHKFLPELIHTLEKVMRDPYTKPDDQYFALKTYLSLTSPQYFSYANIEKWFTSYWQKHPPQSQEKAKALLKEVLAAPINNNQVDKTLINDVRNRLNALPPSYFYYLIAKKDRQENSKELSLPGFILAHNNIPQAMTKKGFNAEIKRLTETAKLLKQDMWALARNDINDVSSLLIKAYCAEYVLWWSQLMQQARLPFVQDFTAAGKLAKDLADGSFGKLVALIQENTKPLPDSNGFIFNDQIAAKFTSLQFLSPAAMHDLHQTMGEIVDFLNTLAVVHDDGQTVFAFVKARFRGDTFSDSLSLLYQRASSLPKPIVEWVKNFADSIWTLLIQEARSYLNKRWRAVIYSPYEISIADRFPFQTNKASEVSLEAFEHFFAPHGILASFVEEDIRPFIDTSRAEWKPKTKDGLVMPISDDMINELIRANIISNMFFPSGTSHGQIDFSLEKVALDPVVNHLSLLIGDMRLDDDQDSHSRINFHWPENSASLQLDSIEGKTYSLSEDGLWAFFRMLQKVNVLIDQDDPSTLQILFAINGNSGRYVLRTKNQLNPFSPGVLDGFHLPQVIV